MAFPGLPAPRTNRTHCIVWSDYSTQAEVALAKGIRLDTNYYYWPPSWVNDVPGLFTGSAMPMRFTKLDGTMIDVFPVNLNGGRIGEITSACYSPRLEKNIGYAMVPIYRQVCEVLGINVLTQSDGTVRPANTQVDLTRTVTVAGEQIELSPDEVIITETPREGWAVAAEAGVTVALDLHLTPELRRAGLAREAIRLIQEARKGSGLEVSDRIVLRYAATDPETAAALEEHRDLVADEVLAVDYGVDAAEDGASGMPFSDEGIGLRFRLRKA